MARLTTAQRNALPSSDFAIPSQRKYPEEDAAHARDALSRVSANGTPAQKAAVRKKAARKFPGIRQKGKAKPKSKMGPATASISNRMLGNGYNDM